MNMWISIANAFEQLNVDSEILNNNLVGIVSSLYSHMKGYLRDIYSCFYNMLNCCICLSLAQETYLLLFMAMTMTYVYLNTSKSTHT